MRALHCVYIIVLTEAKAFASPRRVEVPEDQKLAQKVDTYPAHFALPVPFGHIYKEGHGDTGFGHKSPVDLLEMEMRFPKNLKEARDILQNADPERIQMFADPPGRQVNRMHESPRDKIVNELGIRRVPTSTNETFRWYDITELQERNLVNPLARSRMTQPDVSRRMHMPPPVNANTFPRPLETFGDMKFNELYKSPTKENFTTCDEFGVHASFYPNDIINLVWIPFYIWSTERKLTAVPHKFTFATKKFVSNIKELYSTHAMAKKIEWQKPKLMLKGRGDFLLIAADKKGLFHALPLINLPDHFDKLNVSLPYTTIRLKIEDPYLAMMFCERNHASIMAVEGNEPPTDREKISEAESIGFHGPGMPVTRDLMEEAKEKQLLQQMEIERQKMTSPQPSSPMPP